MPPATKQSPSTKDNGLQGASKLHARLKHLGVWAQSEFRCTGANGAAAEVGPAGR